MTLKAENIDKAELDKWFSSVAGRKHKLFVFVHGFNSTLPEAAYRLAQIVHDSGMEAAAPDLDVDIFRSELQQIGSPRPRTTVDDVVGFGPVSRQL